MASPGVGGARHGRGRGRREWSALVWEGPNVGWEGPILMWEGPNMDWEWPALVWEGPNLPPNPTGGMVR